MIARNFILLFALGILLSCPIAMAEEVASCQIVPTSETSAQIEESELTGEELRQQADDPTKSLEERKRLMKLAVRKYAEEENDLQELETL